MCECCQDNKNFRLRWRQRALALHLRGIYTAYRPEGQGLMMSCRMPVRLLRDINKRRNFHSDSDEQERPNLRYENRDEKRVQPVKWRHF